MIGKWPRRVVLVHDTWGRIASELGQACAEGFRENGCLVEASAQVPASFSVEDLVIGLGPLTGAGSFFPHGGRGRLIPDVGGAKVPVVGYWLSEPMPDARIPVTLMKQLVRAMATVDPWPDRAHLAEARAGWKGAIEKRLYRQRRLRILSELRWLQEKDLLQLLVVTTPTKARYLRQHGFPTALIAPLPYYLGYGHDLGLARAIPVCFLGSNHSRRRARLVESIGAELASRGIPMVIKSDIYGAERTEFLNQTKVILNIARAPHDPLGLRFLIAGANKTLVVSEPLQDYGPFLPGRHIVISPVNEITEAIAYYLHHEAERVRLAEQSYQFVTAELNAARICGLVLEHARARFRS